MADAGSVHPVPIVAGALSALFAGVGQLYAGQRRRGIAYLLTEAAFIFVLFTLLWGPLRGLITLMPQGRFTDSRHILIVGILAGFVVVAYALFHVANIADAVRTASRAQAASQAARRPGAISLSASAVRRHAGVLGGTPLTPYLYIAPSLISAFFIIIVPLVFGVSLAFTNYNLYHCPPAGRFDWIGLTNFAKLLKPGSTWRSQLDMVMTWNVTYAVLGTVLAFAAGMGLALALQTHGLRFRRIFRMILMLPWAVPATVSIMVFLGLFNTSFGPINVLLRSSGMRAIPWFQDRLWARASVLMTHVWISTPFNMSIISAALQSIPEEVYEAARVDGASRWQVFSRMTFPLLMLVVSPIALLTLAGNFNNFGIIYLLTGGGPAVAGSKGAGATDILMTWVYNLGFQQLQWSTASALAVLVFIFVVIFSMINFRLSGVLSQLKQEE
ncbi:MAG TPA: sugar ABC transporter permease [Bacillota bacterium]|jgi:arabinogalactan oligomer/maltooligosaccharide transport system permease protein|nr:sugar ABC transporter permease [Bacillota bacterium]